LRGMVIPRLKKMSKLVEKQVRKRKRDADHLEESAGTDAK